MASWLKDLLERLLATVIGIVVTVAAFLFYFIPKRDWARRDEAQKKFAETLAEEQRATDARAKTTAAQLAEIEKKADAALRADSVDLANEIIGGKK
jgi:biopolymer transport protein ExbB/TolQ